MLFFTAMGIKTNYKIKIEHILEKGSGQLNEDSLVIGENLFGVFDGATSLDTHAFEGGQTGGMIAAQTASHEFSKNHFPLDQLGIRANQAIRIKMIDQSLDMAHRHNLWSTSAAVIRIEEEELEWFQTGDAQILLFYNDGSFKVLADRKDHDYETLTMLKAEKFKFNAAMKDQIKKVRFQMNRSYGVLNGEPEALNFTQNGFESLEDVNSILLFTDGLQLPSTTPAQKKSFGRLAQKFQEEGLTGVKESIRKIESQDPDIIRYPRFKCHDDIAAIAVHL
jgi:serine/threonine protein phosphatase PrpC